MQKQVDEISGLISVVSIFNVNSISSLIALFKNLQRHFLKDINGDCHNSGSGQLHFFSLVLMQYGSTLYKTPYFKCMYSI